MTKQKVRKGFAEAFSLLSEFYKFPTTDFYQAIDNGQLQKELASYLNDAGLNYDVQFEATFSDAAQMKKAFNDSLVGIDTKAAQPVESVYKIWTEDKSCKMAFASSKGYLMGDPAEHIQFLLDEYGLTIPEGLGKKPDHLSLLLELVAYLLERLTNEELLAFTNEHLDWLADFQEKLVEVQAHQFYVEVTQLLQKFVQDFQKEITKL